MQDRTTLNIGDNIARHIIPDSVLCDRILFIELQTLLMITSMALAWLKRREASRIPHSNRLSRQANDPSYVETM